MPALGNAVSLHPLAVVDVLLVSDASVYINTVSWIDTQLCSRCRILEVHVDVDLEAGLHGLAVNGNQMVITLVNVEKA